MDNFNKNTTCVGNVSITNRSDKSKAVAGGDITDANLNLSDSTAKSLMSGEISATSHLDS